MEKSPFGQTLDEFEGEKPKEKVESDEYVVRPPTFDSPVSQTQAEQSVEPMEGAAPVGAAAGAAYGLATRKMVPPRPTSQQFDAAQEAYRQAETLLEGLRNAQAKPGAIAQAEQAVIDARTALQQIATRLSAFPSPPPALTPTQAAAATAARLQELKDIELGITDLAGAPKWVNNVIGQTPDNAIIRPQQLENKGLTNFRANSELGGQNLINELTEGLSKADKLTGERYPLTSAGVAVSPEVHAERNAAFEKRMQEKLLAERAEAAQREAQRLALQRQQAAQDLSVRNLEAELTKRQRSVTAADDAARSLDLAKNARDAAEKIKAHPLSRAGWAIASHPVLSHMLGGLGTAMSAQDAINSYRQGDPLNAISSGIEAGFGGLSMLPFLPAKAIGAGGGLTAAGAKALADYLGSKYSWGTSREAEEAFRPSSRPRPR